MTPEQWQQIERVVDAALTLPPGERAPYLDGACGDDAWLRSAVDGWLRACIASDGFLDEPAAAARELRERVERDDADDDGAAARGALIGPYRVVREIARGGMGVVYLAERADGQFEQQVALKLIRRGVDSADIHRRFLAERQILASLDHPNIARLLDGGATEGGQQWFAMELVDGTAIVRHCDARRLPTSTRLRLFLDVCAAVSHAHQHLVVHRDLKPSNVLVTADGRAKLLDFGIAKLLDAGALDGTGATAADGRALTPEYASPEQVRGAPVTTATDVYALGAVLYELLTGRRAHRFRRDAIADLARVICEVDPVPPSSVVMTPSEATPSGAGSPAADPERASAARGTTPERLRRELRADLDAIVLKALRKDPARRYDSVDALADDVRRYLAGLPVSARSGALSYRAAKFARRHRVAVTLGAVVLLALVGGLAGTLWQARSAAREAATAREVTSFVIGIFRAADPNEALGKDVTAAELLARGRARLDTALQGQPAVRGELLDVLGVIHKEVGLYPAADTLLRRSLQLTIATRGAAHPDVAARLADWADALIEGGEVARADSALRAALRIRRSALGADHPDVATTLRALAIAEEGRGEYVVAESLARQALAIDRRSFGDRHRQVAADLAEVGSALMERGELARADSALQAALSIRRAVLPPDSPELLVNLGNLGALQQRRGDFAAAERTSREVLERRRRVLAPDHPDIALAMSLLASSLRSLHRYAEAESINADALTIARARLPAGHPRILALLNQRAILTMERGDFPAAERAFRELYAAAGAALGAEHQTTVRALDNLAATLRFQGKYAAAEPLQREALAVRTRLFGERHPAVALSWEGMGDLMRERGDLPAAERAYRHALAAAEATRGRGDASDRHASVTTSLALVLVDRGRAAEAEPLLRRALASYLAAPNAPDPGATRARRYLGFCLAALGRDAEAESLMVQGLRELETAPGAPWRLERSRQGTRRRLVAFYRARGRPRDAARYRALVARAP